MGKYSHLKGKFAVFENPDKSYQARVNQTKSQIKKDHQTVSALCEYFVTWKLTKKQRQEEIEEANLFLEALSQLLKDHLEEEEIENLTLESGVTLFLKINPLAQVFDPKKLMDWIKRGKRKELLSVNANTLTAYCKEILDTGKKLPPGVKIFMRSSIGSRGVSGQKKKKQTKEKQDV
ncbi:hypothetical protein LCGC14_0812300 [marine sediment metagenome]|uniref:Uncharacterized protein n=1 Tax=marine sediment metagenome TaxID=412755 RepID=A0A0F9Q6L7_9ZZZZ